jgi:cell division protein ZapA
MPAHKVKLEICGSSYVVSTNDSEEYLLGLAERLDRDMNQMMIDSPNASVAAAAVITALAYLDESEKSAFGADNMRAQIQGYLEDASKARLAAEDLKRENGRLRNELKSYENRARTPRPAGADLLLDYGQAEDTPPTEGAAPTTKPDLDEQ